MYFLDFESYSAAIPDFEGLAPWEHYPFAYSLCRADSWQELSWVHSYIAEPGTDGRPQIAGELVERLGTEGSILVYGIEFEHFVLARMRDALAEHQPELEKILTRLRDLQHPFAEFAYYHPAQGSKISLKTILPILTSGLVHGDLTVQNGAHASFGYYFLAHPDQVPPALAMDAQTRTDFLAALDEYSRLDTEGLFRIVQSLSKLVGLW